MGCNCGGQKLVWRVTFPNGDQRDYRSEAEAKAAADATGGTYLGIRQ